MPFKYRSITANCGNDTLGQVACGEITRLLERDEADFCVINCQEVHFKNTQKQLESLVKQGYKVACLSQMKTHTKWDTQLPTTGMATFVIYKDGLDLSIKESVKARRSSNRASGSGYNKGGLVTHFTVTKGGEKIDVQAVTGHLDASHVVKRNQDWHVLYRATVKEVNNWEDLVSACPNLLISGYDANTRNRFDDNGSESNMWDAPDTHPEIHALHRVSMAAAQYSKDETYSHIHDGEKIADPKRPGYAARGMLDFVTIHGGNILNGSILPQGIDDTEVIQVEPETGSKRDHHVIISPPQTYIGLNEFERVKNQMASRLFGVAPDLAKEILAMKDEMIAGKFVNRAQLLDIYNLYLSPNGFLDKAIGLHRSKLECVQQLMDVSLDESLKMELSQTLFGEHEWCAGKPEQLAAKQELMQVFLDSLAQCEHSAGVRTRLDCYLELNEKIAKNEKINAADVFKDLPVREYQKLYNALNEALQAIQTDDAKMQKLKEAGSEVLTQLDAIVDHNNQEALQSLAPKNLDKLTHIVEQCNNFMRQLNEGKIENTKGVDNTLMDLSHKAMGSSSSAWRTLAKAVEFFVSRIVSVISEISPDPEFTAKVKAGSDNLEIVQNKRLSDTIVHYKSALKEIIPPDDQEDEQSHLLQ